MCKKCYEEALVNNLYNMCDENRLDDVKARNRLSKYENMVRKQYSKTNSVVMTRLP